MSDQDVNQVPGEIEEDLDVLKDRLKEMEEEAKKLRTMQEAAEKEMNLSGEAQNEVDARSVYVGNVDYSATPEEIQAHFQGCGTINRVTILCDKWTGHPKGYAYVEFAEPSLVSNALLLNDTTLKGRQITVVSKRTNVPGLNARGRGRGRGYRGGYRGRGGFRGRGRRPYYAPY